MPIALLRSGRCECDDDPSSGQPARTIDATQPVPLHVHSHVRESPTTSRTAPRYGGRDRIRTLPKMVTKPLPERYVALHRSRSAKPRNEFKQ